MNKCQPDSLSGLAGAEQAQDLIGIMPASGGSVPGVEDHGEDQISAPGPKLHYLGGVCGSL